MSYKESINKIHTFEQAKNVSENWKSKGEKVVFTNGCFDLVHVGHVDYLEKARKLGDRLIVGLNTDNSVKRLKGDSRPVNNEMFRARILASMQFIDAVIFFDQDTPQELITEVLPNILVKGDDYKISEIVGAKEVIANGGKVQTIAFVEGYSSTKLIEKIKAL
ncbi:D-glycero-beta-D-manno-heptose 1-phosphate adenylyltransferase [Aureibacter tunicatorum]|uniref:D-glycero-beta-D-manno-heptose 1-phosphate adenylyltransferase n=1 Tax=Aureibacter tunicatorum TaxID=866807 RepID=A0AAE4BRL6_9BACT|nr:D-glycero-beta-D-manno-heptose 1-phosphate adenylyltransferase [Aureibacter tunicatorum]MDR6237342.1 rfaE bifunctional protein nucleotidyltransferase chain/domain [Aureibacter tunicatorum]BDD06333.1 hypothetical protein AUTU_38160 [Aureibacter tunicatorum]